MLKWAGPVDILTVNAQVIRGHAFGSVQGANINPTLGSRVAKAITPLLGTYKVDHDDLVLARIATDATVALSPSPTSAGRNWHVVVEGIRFADRPSLAWDERQGNALEALLEMARTEAQARTADDDEPTGILPLAPPAIEAELREKRAAMDHRLANEAAAARAQRQEAQVRLTVEQYASLCAERERYPHAIDQVAGRYGFGSEGDLEAEDGAWQRRFKLHASLEARFHEVRGQWVAWLQQLPLRELITAPRADEGGDNPSPGMGHPSPRTAASTTRPAPAGGYVGA